MTIRERVRAYTACQTDRLRENPVRPVCIPCKVTMRPTLNGQMVRLGDQLWQGDRYQCPGCQAEVVTGFGATPWGTVSSEDSAAWLPSLLTVTDA